MKRTLKLNVIYSLICLFSLAILTSCSKKESDNDDNDDPQSKYYIKFKRNGVNMDYRAEVTGQWSKSSTSFVIGIGAGSEEPLIATSGYIALQALSLTEELKVNKKYTNQTSGSAGGASWQYHVDYVGGALINKYNAGTFTDHEVTFTELTNDHAKGVFKATVKLYAGTSTTTTIQLTEGEFYIPWK